MATTIPQTYTVQAGDSLSLISKKMYGDFSMVNALLQANPTITNPNLIHPGQKLIIPVPSSSVNTNSPVPGSSASSSSSSSTSTSTTTTVKKTIGKIFGWGIVGLAALLLAYEANKQKKKNKAAKAPKADSAISGVATRRKKKSKRLKAAA